MTASFIDDINFWKQKLPEEDRNRLEYIVIPSNWMVAPVNYIPNDNNDYDSLINWKEVNVNKYLKTWVMAYPWASTNNYWEAWNKVIYWHSSYWKIDSGRYKTHFQKIIELDAWEEIWVYKALPDLSFKRYIYKVNKSYETESSDISVLNPWIWSNLTLITCVPIWWIDSRWIVKAEYENNNKTDIVNYLNWNNVANKYKVAMNNFARKVSSLDAVQKRDLVINVFNKIVELEDKYPENKKLSDLFAYIKLRLAIIYNS